MRIVCANAANREAWDAFVLGHPAAGPYHSFAWLEAVRGAYGFEQASLLARRDGQVVGVLPLVRMPMPGRRARLVSLPYCDYGGPLAEDEQTCARLLEHALDAAGQQGLGGVVVRRHGPGNPASGKVLMRLALPQGSEALLRSFPAKLRSQIRKPGRDGLVTVSGGEEMVGEFYAVVARNMRDLGSPAHSQAWFRAIARAYGTSGRVWITRLPGGSPAAAGMTLALGGLTCVPWASSLREHNRSNANMLLYWSMLSRAADDGQAVFDFGRSSPGGGTYRFKRQWGARESALDWAVYDPETGLVRKPSPVNGTGGLRRLAEAGWRRLPLPVANLAGPVLRRYISL